MKRNRPWDKRHRLPVPETETKCDEVPFVEIQKQKFHSDRFYLNTSLLDPAPTNSEAPHAPLFNRSAWIQSYFENTEASSPKKIEAIVFGTYTLDWKTLIQEFPSVFAPSSRVPCLVLYGKKNWTDDAPSPACDASVDEEDDDSGSIGSTPENQLPAVIGLPSDDLTVPNFPATVHFSQMTASWWNRTTAAASLSWTDIVDPATGFLESHIIHERQGIPHGVHHSKYILVWEADGSLVVSVSTANLTPPMTTDATWIQRFPAIRVKQATAQPVAHSKKMDWLRPDFGRTLTHYLQVSMLSTAANQVTIHWFVQKYLHWKSIRDLEIRYDFSAAQVDLVAVVPGEYNARCFNETTLINGQVGSVAISPHRFLYGQERISFLVRQLKASLPPKYQGVMYSEKDRLIVQPTSFGGGWNSFNMSDLVRSYLCNAASDQDALMQVDIVWPSEKLIADINRNVCHGAKCDDKDGRLSSEKNNGGFLFLSSESFNNIDLSCLSRMVLFEPSTPPQRPVLLTPHFKSIARLMDGPDKIGKDFPHIKEENSSAYFSWFLLTSACLSRGAQGAQVPHSPQDMRPDETMFSYTNFELGVLFGSRVSGSGKSADDRIYCWRPNSAVPNNPSLLPHQSPRLIHLPIPFHVTRPQRYLPNEEVTLFSETPFFHEIVPGTGCEGNMQLTPYGMALAKQCHEDVT